MSGSSSESTFSVSQDIVSSSGPGSSLLVRTVHEHFLTSAHIGDLLSTVARARDGLSDAFGVAPIFSVTGPQQLSKYAPRSLYREEGRKLEALAFATSTTALVVFLDRTLKGCDASRVNMKGKKGKDRKRGRALLNNMLLGQDIPPVTRKFAIDADALTASLHISCDLRISHLADALSLSKMPPQMRAHNHDIATRVQAHLQQTLVNQKVNAVALRDILADSEPIGHAVADGETVRMAVLRAWLARAIAAHAGKHEFLDRARVVDSATPSKEELDTVSRMFSEGQRIASLNAQREVNAALPVFALADTLRTNIIARALSDPSALFSIALFRAIFPADAGIRMDQEDFWDDAPALPPSAQCDEIPGVNALQADVIQRSLNDRNEDRIILVHGPPGTGKTTAIAALCTAAAATRPVWVLSQSNAIAWAAAARLLSTGFQGFRLLVGSDSKQYNPLYPELEAYTLTTDENMTRGDVKALVSDGVRVIVCTLGRVVNRRLRCLKEALPVQTVVIDEVGQIDINELIPLLQTHSKTLARLIFVGDEKQLPPHQQGNVPSLRNIFEVKHLQNRRIAIDTQYRMPQILTSFFSRRVYNGGFSKLERSAGSWRACRFVDVAGPKAASQRKINDPANRHLSPNDKDAAIMAAQRYSREGLNFKIIAAMEGHRVALAQRVEEAGLSPSLCVTITDFHGSEANHVIVYLGRSWKVDARDERRLAVMLSRCRDSMLICTSKRYLESDDAKETLAAVLAKDCGPRSWITWDDFVEERWPLVRD